ncbi:MAG TPA: response regulator transcription factor [Gemmatimonadales bacterium]|nr:response regulator transcription factor [Gemmatimonadales bacterium]
MSDRPTLLLVDDHALMTEGLRAMLEPEYEVLEVVRDGAQVVAAVQFHGPDLVLLDLSLPGRSGLEIAADLHERFPGTRVLIVTMHAERIYADEALRAGASGYVLKLARAEELKHAIEEALAGRQYVTPLLTEHTAADAARVEPRGHPEAAGLDALTERQREVLRLIARGCTTQEIADALAVSAKAVEFHRVRIRKVLGLSSTAALVRYAVNEGLV